MSIAENLKDFAIKNKICKKLSRPISGTTEEDIVFRESEHRLDDSEKKFFNDLPNDIFNNDISSVKTKILYKNYQPDILGTREIRNYGSPFYKVPNGMYTFAIAVDKDENIYITIAQVINKWEIGARHSSILKNYNDKVLSGGEMLIEDYILKFNFLSFTFFCTVRKMKPPEGQPKNEWQAKKFAEYAVYVHKFFSEMFPKYKIESTVFDSLASEFLASANENKFNEIVLIKSNKILQSNIDFIISYCEYKKEDIFLIYYSDDGLYEYNYCKLLKDEHYKRSVISEIKGKHSNALLWEEIKDNIKETTGASYMQLKNANKPKSPLDFFTPRPIKYNGDFNLEKATAFAQKLINDAGFSY